MRNNVWICHATKFKEDGTNNEQGQELARRINRAVFMAGKGDKKEVFETLMAKHDPIYECGLSLAPGSLNDLFDCFG